MGALKGENVAAENPKHSPTEATDPAAWLRKKRERRIEAVRLDDILGEPCTIYVRGLTQREAALWEAAALDRELKPIPESVRNHRERLLVITVCDAAGRPYLSKDDLDALAEFPAAAVGRLFAKAKELSDIKDEKEEAKDLAGN